MPEYLRRTSLEWRQAMFTALVVARATGETAVSWERLLGAMLRTDQVGRFCDDAGISISTVLALTDAAEVPPFSECMAKIEAELAARGHGFGSREHVACEQPLPIVEARPLFTSMETFFDGAPEDASVTPLHLLGALLGKPEIAALLATEGLTQELVHNALHATSAGENR
jgi:hypothetical protein